MEDFVTRKITSYLRKGLGAKYNPIQTNTEGGRKKKRRTRCVTKSRKN